MFSDRFLAAPTETIVDALRHQGVFALESALDADVADAILADVDDLRFEVNRNAPPNVVHKGQTYANHYLARSRAAFDLVTHPRVTSVLKAGLGDVFRMISKRVYETRAGHYMQFHSDTGVPCADPMQLDTIVFIFYLNDVEQGEWEIVEGSHLWGETMLGSREDDDALVARPEVVVKGFKMPKGSLVIYNGRTLHRAKQFEDASWARRSLFFQVNRNARDGEPILVNTGFIRPDLSEEAKMLLGFGQPSSIASFPNTSAKTLPVGRNKALQDYLLEALPMDALFGEMKRRKAEAAAVEPATSVQA